MKYFIIILLLYTLPASASFYVNDTVGAKPLALSGAYTARAEEVYSIFYNPSGLVYVNSFELLFAYVNPYNVNDLYQITWAGALKSKYGSFAISFDYLYYKSIYKEETLLFSYANKISKKINAGINLKHFYRFIDDSYPVEIEYKFFQRIGVDIGFTVEINEFIKAGAVAFNINKPEILKEEGPPRVRFGLFIYPLFAVSKFTSIEKDYLNKLSIDIDVYNQKSGSKSTPEIVLGIEYKITDYWSIQSGTDLSRQFTAGMSINFKKFFFDYTFVTQ